MTWFKVDDGFYDHPKFGTLPNAAVGLWAKAGAWCGRHLTDGAIPATQVRALKGTTSQVNALLSAGIWTADRTENGAKLYRFHDWNEYQPSKEEKLKERADAAERQRKSRERKRQEQEERENVTRDSHVPVTRDSQTGVTRESRIGVTPPRPDPTRPDLRGGEVGDQPHPRATARRDSPPETSSVWLAADAASPRPDWVRGTVDDPRCPTHEHLAPDAVPACTRCRRARDWLEAHEATVAEAERDARRAARDTCPVCHGDTIITLPDGRGWRCPHDGTTPPKTSEKGAQSDEHDAPGHSPQPDTPIRPTGTGGPF